MRRQPHSTDIVTVHSLKIFPEFFEAVRSGAKKAEVRDNDRNFKVNDTILLHEYENGIYTGEILCVRITYISDYNQPPGQVVLSIEVQSKEI
ncbi:DUF3850 domain-containing protein [Listeria grandensis]|uniref:DUF3850 domain-containing protein n=1 Tax=Listeria grandensis TaxID=1494963 RepID=A0A7X1CNP3_9LIST|nr:DUF3850 domain-containing protein [Listeria grandensis]MBC1935200.1 DUF3850 domain-containing protein [Listeria grandensis]